MVKININGVKFETYKEMEIFSNSEFGFNVTLIHQNKNLVINNVTEIHLFYVSILKYSEHAFESDIHATGITKNCNDVDEIIIKNSDSISKNFIEYDKVTE